MSWIIDGIPRSQKMAIAAGIGLFLGILALKHAGLIAPDKDTYVTLGDLHRPSFILAAIGFIAMVALDARKVPGAIPIAVLGVTVAGIALGVSPFGGVVSLPPSLAPTFLAMDLKSLFNMAGLLVVLAFFFVDLFDSTGTLIGVAHQAGLAAARTARCRACARFWWRIRCRCWRARRWAHRPSPLISKAQPGLRRAAAPGWSASWSPSCSCSACSSRRWPAACRITPPRRPLLFVACLMVRSLTEIAWDDATDFAPALVTALAMPLTFSISNGIALGFITFAGVKLLAGRWREIGWPMAILAVLFVAHYAVG